MERVNAVLLHKNPHLDEILGYRLLCIYGKQQFPGIESAQIRYANADISGTDASFDADGILPIGIGHGRFDEHTAKSQSGRMEGESATTLIAKYLDISANLELTRLIDEALYCDTKSGVTSSQIAEIIKTAHRQHRLNCTNQVLDWAMKGLDAIILQERYKFTAEVGEKSLAVILEVLLQNGLDTINDRVRQSLGKIVEESMKGKDARITELAHIVECMFRSGRYEETMITEWVEFALCTIISDQTEFWEQVGVAKGTRPVTVLLKTGFRPPRRLKLLVCNTDSRHANKAARYIGADLVLVRQTTGNCQIFQDGKIEGLNLDNAIRMIRWLELPNDMKNRFDWHELGCDGQANGINHWYYFRKGGMIFNGSDTHSATPTKIGTQALVEVLEHAFSYEGVKAWCNARRITMVRRSAEAKPSSAGKP